MSFFAHSHLKRLNCVLCLPPQLMTPLTISLEVVAVTSGAQVVTGWAGHSLILGPSQDSGLALLVLIQVLTSLRKSSHLVDTGNIKIYYAFGF